MFRANKSINLLSGHLNELTQYSSFKISQPNMVAFGKLAKYSTAPTNKNYPPFRPKNPGSSKGKGYEAFSVVIACLTSGSLLWYGVRKKRETLHAATTQQVYMRPVLIKNGVIVNADSMYKKDIYIENGVISKIGEDIATARNAIVVDAEHNYILPGGVDPNTHLEMEMMGEVTADDFFTGTRAALAGGTTTIIDYAIPAKGESLIAVYDKYRKMASKACCDYGIHVGVTWWSDKVAEEMDELCKKHGVNSFKTFMAFKDIWQLPDTDLYSVFKQCRKLGAIALIHAENGDFIHDNQKKILELGFKGPEGHLLSRPEDAEAEAVGRACGIAYQTMCPLYVDHVMSKTAASVLAEKRREGCVVYGETLVSALGTDGSHYFNPSWLHAAAHVVCPPLRPDSTTSDHLVHMLNKDGLQVVGSDHCVFSGHQKMIGMNDFTKIPTGTNGVEDRLAVTWEKAVYQGHMDPMRFVEITSTNPAKIFNLYPKKGCIQVGSDADLVIWDAQDSRTISAQTHNQAVDFNIFEGMEVHGVPKYVFLRGIMVVDKGQLKTQSGMGKFLEMKPYPKHVYSDIYRQEDVTRKSSSPGRKVSSTKGTKGTRTSPKN